MPTNCDLETLSQAFCLLMRLFINSRRGGGTTKPGVVLARARRILEACPKLCEKILSLLISVARFYTAKLTIISNADIASETIVRS